MHWDAGQCHRKPQDLMLHPRAGPAGDRELPSHTLRELGLDVSSFLRPRHCCREQ